MERIEVGDLIRVTEGDYKGCTGVVTRKYYHNLLGMRAETIIDPWSAYGSPEDGDYVGPVTTYSTQDLTPLTDDEKHQRRIKALENLRDWSERFGII